MIPLGGTGMRDSRVGERSKSMGRSHLPAKLDRFSVVFCACAPAKGKKNFWV